jgi:hypothetical protein
MLASSQALTALRQKVKKYNKSFENDIEKYRENPQDSEGEEPEKEKSGKFSLAVVLCIGKLKAGLHCTTFAYNYRMQCAYNSNCTM